MDPFVAKVRSTIEEHHLLSPGDAVVIGVSGGPDSLALLFSLRELAGDHRLRLTVAHLDHGLRGAESESDVAFVGDLAKHLDLPFVLGRADVRELARGRGLGLEEAAREARYGFLARAAEERGAGKVAVGHTRNDQAETVLMRLLRGAGTDGLAGMAAFRRLGRGLLIRPLLETTREETEDYCRRLGVQAREDRTNLDPAYLRNRVRRRLLPLLAEEFNPSIVDGLADLARRMSDEADLLRDLTGEAYESVAVQDEDGRVRLDLEGLTEQPRAIRRRLIRRAVRAAGLGPGPQAERVEAALRLALEGRTGARVEIGGGGLAVREPDALVICSSVAAVPAFAPLALPLPGRVDLPAVGLTISAEFRPAETYPGEAGIDRQEAFLDADAVPAMHGGLVVRPRRPGDAFHPQGAPGRKKLKDFFIDLKVPRHDRDRIPVVALAADPGTILWVAGYRIDDRFKVTPRTTRLVHLSQARQGP